MISIYVKTADEKAFAEKAMQREVMHNPNLNGADFEVVIDEDQGWSIEPNNLTTQSLMRVVFKQPSED